MITLATDWGVAWTMAGISVGVVFSILLLLVLVLMVFSYVAQGKPATAAPATAEKPADAPKSAHKVSAADEAAVATAVYLYLGGRHDEESGVITIHVNEHSLWHEELNDRL